jgi:hypothetical protein
MADKVIKDAYWEGFQSGLGDGMDGSLEYGEYPWSSFNVVRQIAYSAGHAAAQGVLAAHVKRLANGKPRIPIGYTYRIPGAVYAECYGEVQLAVVT